MTNHKRKTEGQEALENTRIIQKSIAEHLDALDLFCKQELFEVFIPSLFANDADHTAEIEWTTLLTFSRAEELTQLWSKLHGMDFPRLTVTFLGKTE